MSPASPSVPDDLKDLFQAIEGEVVWLHGRWLIYRQLFGANERRVDLLNHSAPTFFALLQRLWFDYIVLEICRITDRAVISGHSNLVVGQLLARLDRSSHPTLAAKLDVLGAEIARASDHLRFRRNKQIAHLDLATALEASQTPLPGISRQDVEFALQAIRDFMNAFRMEFLGGEMGYESFAMQDDAERLIVNLKRAAEYREIEKLDPDYRVRWKSGPFRDA
jgi:hypothetical protein